MILWYGLTIHLLLIVDFFTGLFEESYLLLEVTLILA